MSVRIIIKAVHRETADAVGHWYNPRSASAYRDACSKVRELREKGYFVVMNDPHADVRIATCDNECASMVEAVQNALNPVRYPYKVHSINTVNQQRQGSHIGFVETLDEALTRAEGCVNSWNPKHKGVVIFQAIKLVRAREPVSPIEIIDL